LQEEGELITCDHDPDITQKAREYWKEAGLAHKISLRVGPAISALDRLISEGGEGAYDFVFIDADKTEYEEYYERSMVLIRSGGLITVDNTLWYGRVADGEVNDEDTVALRKFNENLHRDDRVHISLLPMSDGLTLALKK
jgi:predicted O-methyltransferase YrrM